MWFILLSPPGRPGDRLPERVSTGVVSPNYFPMLGVRAALGRLLTADDDRAGAPAVLLLTHDYWQRAFDGDPSVVGRVFEMNDRPHTVVGVLRAVPAVPAGGGRLHADVGLPVPIEPGDGGGPPRAHGPGHRPAPPTVSRSSRCRRTWRGSRPASSSANPAIYAVTRTDRYVATASPLADEMRQRAAPDAAAAGRPRRHWCCHRLRQRQQPDAGALHAALARAVAARRARRHAAAGSASSC